ncbi:MAG: helix-turn-helix domain-containing protein [Clostridia bacterium]|nr:helix-turn-helix domain-containing protein [Clostridia bacterium]
MKKQTYYIGAFESDANRCDESVDIAVNCAGVVDETVDVDHRSVRRDYYLMYVVEGAMHIELDGICDRISAGQLLIIQPGVLYHYCLDCDSRVNYMWIHFTGKNLPAMLSSLRLESNRIYNAGLHHSMELHWTRLFGEFVRNDEYFSMVSNSILTEILAAFSRYIHTPSDKKNFVKSITYIHQNYSEAITVGALAEMENLSEPHYRACFRRSVGMSPMEYITDVRMRAAVQLLESTEKKLAEISQLCGYNDVYYFIRAFKRKTGVTPGKYRGV